MQFSRNFTVRYSFVLQFSQVLQVFDTADEREIARNKICKTLHGDYMPSGVTPPTADIVKRRFELTRKNDTFLPYRIRAVIEEINSFGNGTGRMVPANYGDRYRFSLHAQNDIIHDMHLMLLWSPCAAICCVLALYDTHYV